MREFVIDCSVSLSWCFEDEVSSYTSGVLEKLKNHRAIVPNLWHLETINGLMSAERQKRINPIAVAHFIAMFNSLPIEVEMNTHIAAFTQVLTLARAYKLSAYDACYLELAIRRQLPLATTDGALKKAAVSSKVEIFR